MTKALFCQRWVRFDHYELVDGAIRPAADAKLRTYDPWCDYAPEKMTPPRKQHPPPYHSLLALLRDIRLDHQTKTFPPDVDGQKVVERVVQWCSEHGLLGILPHRARVMFLAPRWEVQPWGVAGQTDFEAVPSQKSFVRIGAEWLGRTRHGSKRGPANAKNDALVPPRSIPQGWPAPYAVVEKLGAPDVEFQKLGDAVTRFFPGVRPRDAEKHAYPLPLTDDFWHAYGEPLEDFLRGALALWDAVSLMASSKYQAAKGRQRLNVLTEGVRPVLQRDTDGSPALGWESPSLLASFAMMFLLDVANAKTVRQCAADCPVVFVADAYQALYCSETCQNRAQKQRYRERAKERARSTT